MAIPIGEEEVFRDLVLVIKGTNTVQFLIEVEKDESVNDEEANQWATYARGPGALLLLVPAQRLQTAKEICQRKGIGARFGKWWLGEHAIHWQWEA